MSDNGAIPEELAGAVKLVVLDVDGVMTDGGIYYGVAPDGSTVEMKRFEITDGLGIKLLQRAGVEVAFVTGRHSEIVEMRGRELGVKEIHQDPAAKKLPIVQDILDRKGIDWNAVAYVSDDLADLPALRRCALPVAVANAVAEVSAVARWQTSRTGGSGAIREFAEMLLRARGDWESVVASYLAEREVGTDG